jgi:hypothetical protein
MPAYSGTLSLTQQRLRLAAQVARLVHGDGATNGDMMDVFGWLANGDPGAVTPEDAAAQYCEWCGLETA